MPRTKHGLPGIYNASPLTLSDGEGAAIALHSNGAAKVVNADGSAIGGGTQYTEADTDSSITGTAVMWEDTSDTLRAVSAAKPLPVTVVSGSAGVTDDSAFTVGTTAVSPVGGTYKSTRDSVDDNDAGAFAMTQKRALFIVPETPNGDLAVDDTYDAVKVLPSSYATDDSAMPATPVTIPVSAEYRASATTYADGDVTVLQSDVNGNLKVTMASTIAGEDITNNRLMVEQRYSYNAVLTADASVKSGAGFLHTLTFSCNDAAPTAGSIIVYDNTAESGTQIFNHTFTTTPFTPLSVILDVSFTTGLYIGFTTTADVNVSVSYR